MSDMPARYEGKAKTLFSTDNPEEMEVLFRDDTSAFDGEKVEKLARKGMINNHINTHIMQALEKAGVQTHFIAQTGENTARVKALRMLPLEGVVRNVAAGSLTRRLGIEKGTALEKPLFEMFLKNDALHDPMVTKEHALAFGWATSEEVEQIQAKSLAINAVLKPLFANCDLTLVDFKVEFGLDTEGNFVLGDEISPDGLRLWDAQTQESLDKDRFRQNLGNVIESYEEIARRLGIALPTP